MLVTRLQTLKDSEYVLQLLNPRCHIFAAIVTQLYQPSTGKSAHSAITPSTIFDAQMHSKAQYFKETSYSCTFVVMGWSIQVTSECFCLVWQIVTPCDRTENNEL